MKMVAGLARYCAFVGVLTVGVVGGAVWLLRADPSSRAEARAPIIPQKMLDSIERKKPVPVQVVFASILKPEPPAPPVMQEAPVSLPKLAIPHRPAKAAAVPRRAPDARRPVPSVATAEAAAPAAAVVVSTARTDFPY
jgi:hypothetical protein